MSSPQGEPLPRKRPELTVRWLVLALLCIGLVGSYFVYDEPTALNIRMKYYFTGLTKDPGNPPGPTLPASEHITEAEYLSNFSWLYSAYSWPNVILPLIGGILSDRLGLRLGNMIFAGLVLAGQCVFALGMSLPGTGTKWGVMIAGRVIFGMGGESLSVTMSALIVKWFSGRELALALGLNLALARLGSVFNDAASPAMAGAFSLAWSLWGGAVICALSFACAVVVYIIDKRAADQLRKNRRKLRAESRAGKAPRSDEVSSKASGAASSLLKTGEPASAAMVDFEVGDFDSRRSSRASDRVEDSETTALTAGKDDGALTAGEETSEEEAEDDGAEDEVVDLRSVLKLPLTLWVLTISCVTVYAAILSFNNIASDFIVTRWPSISADTANYYMAVTYTTAGLVSPFLGAFIDRVGMRAVFCLAAAVVVTAVHLLLGLTYADPIIGLVFMGLAYSFYAAALWPSVALVTEDAVVGTAYGLCTAVQNLGLASVPLLIAKMQSTCPANYECVSVTFAAFAACGIVSGIVLQWMDCTSRVPILNLPEAEIRKKKDEMMRLKRGTARGITRESTDAFHVSQPSPTGAPGTPLLDSGLDVGRASVTGLSLPPAATEDTREPASLVDTSGSPRITGLVHPRRSTRGDKDSWLA